MQRFLALVCFLMLTGCGIPLTREAFNASAEAQALRSIVDRMTSHDFASIRAQLDPQLVEPDIPAALERTANAIPIGPITSVNAVAWNVFVGTNSPRTAFVAAEYAFGGNQWIVASARLTGEPTALRILQFNVEPLPAPMAQIHAFTLVGKGIAHFVFLAATIAAALVSLWALVRCVRTKALRRKWLWVMFVAIGFVSFTINWTTGAVQVNPLTVNLLSAGVLRQGWVGPWTLTFCIPIGALVFLWRQRSRSQHASVAA